MYHFIDLIFRNNEIQILLEPFVVNGPNKPSRKPIELVVTVLVVSGFVSTETVVVCVELVVELTVSCVVGPLNYKTKLYAYLRKY